MAGMMDFWKVEEMDSSMVLIMGLGTAHLRELLMDFRLVHYSWDDMWVERRAC